MSLDIIGLAATISEIGYLLLPSRDKSSKQPTNQPTRYFDILFILPYMFVYYNSMTSPLWLAVGPQSLEKGVFTNVKMCTSLIAHLLWLVGRLGTRKPVQPHKLDGCNYSNWPSLVCPQSFCYLCLVKFWYCQLVLCIFRWHNSICHRTDSDPSFSLQSSYSYFIKTVQFCYAISVYNTRHGVIENSRWLMHHVNDLIEEWMSIFFMLPLVF